MSPDFCAQQGLLTKNTTYPAMVALFTVGRGAFMIERQLGSSNPVDLQKQAASFEYGIVPFQETVRKSGYLGRFSPTSDSEQPEGPAVSGKSRRRAGSLSPTLLSKLTWAGEAVTSPPIFPFKRVMPTTSRCRRITNTALVRRKTSYSIPPAIVWRGQSEFWRDQ